MAQRVVVKLEDDYDGQPIAAEDAEPQTELSVDGTVYQLDLRAENVLLLWDAIDPFIRNTTPVRTPKKAKRRYTKKAAPAPAAAPQTPAEQEAADELVAVRPETEALVVAAEAESEATAALEDNGPAGTYASLADASDRRAARDWGRQNGYKVGTKGRLSPKLISDWKASQGAHPAAGEAAAEG